MKPAVRVVLVHGIYDTGAVFDTFATKLREQGYEVIQPDLVPNNASVGLDKLAMQVKYAIDKAYGPQSMVHIVGFSMGGLVSRHYLQKLGGAARCATFITISSPHHGSMLSYLSWGEGITHMRPGSTFIRDLEQGDEVLKHMILRSYWTSYDLMIIPAHSSVWAPAVNIHVPVLLHPWMLDDVRVQRGVMEVLHAWQQNAAVP